MQNASKSKPIWVWSEIYKCVVRVVGRKAGKLLVELPDDRIVESDENFQGVVV